MERNLFLIMFYFCVTQYFVLGRSCSPARRCEIVCGQTECKNVTRNCYCMPGYYRQPKTLQCVGQEECDKQNDDDLNTPQTLSTLDGVTPTQTLLMNITFPALLKASPYNISLTNYSTFEPVIVKAVVVEIPP